MHIANISSASCDDLLEPVDLGQTPADVIVLSFSGSDLSALARAWEKDREQLPDMRLASLSHLRHPMSVDLWIDTVARHAKVILVRLLGGYDYWSYGCDQLAEMARREKIALAFLPGEDSAQDDRLAKISTIKEHDLEGLLDYFRAGGARNMSALVLQLAALAGEDVHVPKCRSVPRMGFYRPGAGPDSCIVELDELMTGSADRVGIIFYRSLFLADDVAPVDALCAALEERGLAVVPIFVPTLKDERVGAFVVKAASRAKLKVLVTTTAFAAQSGRAGRSLFERIGVPVFQAILATTRLESWREQDRGLGISDLAMNVILPELDGRLLAGAISFKSFEREVSEG
ncbi:MAG: cobaltochelatase subunit CobN, partial [Hyphomicrobiaceae bacterium]|nr:cobaltochelatase subunit CobN [Hyphomicrobiaceae bacterium]